MKTGATPELVALLRSGDPVWVFDLYECDLTNSTILRYTTADIDLEVDGETYHASVAFERSKITEKAGLEVDNLEMTAYADDSDFIGGLEFHQALVRGALDGAYLVLRRAFYADLASVPVATLIRFTGRLGDIISGGLQAQITVKSDLEILSGKMPRNLYQAPCGHLLYDAGCGKSQSAYAVYSTVKAGCTTILLQTNLTQAAGWFDLGKLIFTSGALNGEIRTVKSQAGDGSVRIIPPLIAAPVSGDAFTIYPGCDRKLETCINKFNNKPHFRGQPYIPVPETAQ